jgi:hypothetical protein
VTAERRSIVYCDACGREEHGALSQTTTALRSDLAARGWATLVDAEPGGAANLDYCPTCQEVPRA